jgi:phage terminase large subunit
MFLEFICYDTCMARASKDFSRVVDFQITPAILHRWGQCPWEYAQQVHGFKATNQQKRAWEEIVKIIQAKEKRGHPLHPNDVILAAEEQKYAEVRGISISAGQGVGKSAWAAVTIMWFATCFPLPLIPITGPKMEQLKDTVWREIARWRDIQNAEGVYTCPTRDWFELASTKFWLKELKGDQGYASLRTCARNASESEQAITMQGPHSDYMVYLVDEASGVLDGIFPTIEGAGSGLCNFAILLGNMNRKSGYFYQTHHGPDTITKYWIRLQWSGLESPLISKDQIKFAREKYGEDSDFWRVRILGLPPASSVNCVIPWEWVHAAIERPISPDPDQPIILGVDCAGPGKDKAVIVARQGAVTLKVLENTKLDPSELEAWILITAQDYEDPWICIDAVGYGAGVADRVSREHRKTKKINVRNVSINERYSMLRDELWFKARERFEQGHISIPDHHRLAEELSSPNWQLDPRGKVKVASKQTLSISPDYADAFLLTFALNDSAYRKSSPHPTHAVSNRSMTSQIFGRQDKTWMSR